MWNSARKRDGLSVFVLLLVLGWIFGTALLIQDYRSPRLEARAMVEKKLERQGRFSPVVRRSVPLRSGLSVSRW
jgi:hypothetical protein